MPVTRTADGRIIATAPVRRSSDLISVMPEPVSGPVLDPEPRYPVIPTEAAKIEAKAAFGTGVTALTYDMPIALLSESPQRKAREAMATFRRNGWVNAAERAVSSGAASVAWHLEDDGGETIDESPALDFLRNPMPEMRLSQRQVWALTKRHMGLVGYTFWYLDQRDLLAGTPLSALYIRPDRMLPALNKRTGRLVGWIMDGDNPDGRQPVAFSPDEIAVFRLEPDDDGILGIGLVEAAWRKLSMSGVVDRHTEKMISSGGRLAGIVSPKVDKSFTDDEYTQIVRELRNVTDSPDAAKKQLIFKVPVDFVQNAATPSQMNLPDLNRLSRDDIMAIWGVPQSQIGITDKGRGLNSGETQKYEEAALWQNAREPRLASFRETLQRDILDRWAILGQNVNLVLEVPTFDDEAPLYANAEKAKSLPLTINQRLEQIGKDPLDEDIYGKLGQAIFIDKSMVPVFLPQGVEVEQPETPEPFGPQQTPELDQPAGPESAPPAKASLGDLRSRLTMNWEPKLRRATAAFLEKQASVIAERVAKRHGHLQVHPDQDAWWNGRQWDRELREALLDDEQSLASTVHAEVKKTLKRDNKAEPLFEIIADRLGRRIVDINETTRGLLATLINDGLKAGQGPAELAQAIREATAFDDARAERISRTETGYAYNEAAINSYRSLEVERVQVIDGDDDAICAPVNGATWTLDEAESNPLGHPNCTRDFVPVVQ